MARFGRRYPLKSAVFVANSLAVEEIPVPAEHAAASATAYSPTVSITFGAGSATASAASPAAVGGAGGKAGGVAVPVEAFDAGTTPHLLVDAELVFADVGVEDAYGGVGPVASPAAVAAVANGVKEVAVPSVVTCTVTVNNASVSISFPAESVSVSSAALDGHADYTSRPAAGEVNPLVSVYVPASFGISFTAGSASASATAYNTAFQRISTAPSTVSGTATAYSPTVRIGSPAGVATADAAVLIGIFSPQPASVTATAYGATIYVDAPDWRTYDVPAESRTLKVAAEDRTYVIPWRLDDVRVR